MSKIDVYVDWHWSTGGRARFVSDGNLEGLRTTPDCLIHHLLGSFDTDQAARAAALEFLESLEKRVGCDSFSNSRYSAPIERLDDQGRTVLERR